MKYKLPAYWRLSGYHIIEAESLEEAQEIAGDDERLEEQGCDCVCEPWTEGDCEDYTPDESGIEEATAEDVAEFEKGAELWALKSRAPAMDAALRVALEALRESETEITRYIKHAQATNPMARYAGAGEKLIAMRDRMLTAITTAEKALGGV